MFCINAEDIKNHKIQPNAFENTLVIIITGLFLNLESCINNSIIII